MASQTDSRAGQSLQNMITCVEEVLHLAGPAKDQLRGLQPYISQLLSQQNDERKHNYEALLAENAQLKNDLLALKSSQLTICSDGESIEKVFAEIQQTIMRGKDEILRINAVRLQAIQEEHIQMQTQLEEMRSTNATLNCQIKSLKNERDELEKSFSDQHEAERQILHSELEKIKKDYEQQSKQLHEVLKERETLKELVASQLNTRNGHSNEEFDAVVKKNEQLQRDLLASQSRHLPAHQELTFTDECNPERIAELYKNLYNNFWPDAFIKGKQFLSFKTDYSVSQEILRVYNAVYLLCKEECARQRVSLEKALSLDSENLFQKSYKILKEVQRIAEKIRPFVQESIRICWLMNLHDPPLACTQTEGAYDTAFDGKMYEYYKCVGDKIDFIVLPALVMPENGLILAKGVVECRTTMK